MPRYSFVIPTLNEKQYLPLCLGSIKKQSGSYEIIVVDSYSRDGTDKVARKYGAKLLFEGRKGPGIARNTGAKKARGNIIIFSDADVVFPKKFLEMIDKRLTPTVGGGICNLVPYDSKNMMTSMNYKLANSLARLFISLGIPLTAGSCFIYRKDVFNKAGGFNPKFMTNEDHDLAKRASKLSRFVFFPEVKLGTSTRRVKKWGTVKAYRIYIRSTLTYWLNHGYLRNYW